MLRVSFSYVHAEIQNAEYLLILNVIMLRVLILRAVMLSGIMLSNSLYTEFFAECCIFSFLC